MDSQVNGQRAMADIRPDELHGRAFIGQPGFDAVDALVEGGLADPADIDQLEGLLRAVILHTSCHPFIPRLCRTSLQECRLVDAAWDCEPFSWGPQMPTEVSQAVARARDRMSSSLNDAASFAAREGRFVQAQNADDAAAQLGTQVATTFRGWFAVPDAPRRTQDFIDAFTWTNRYSFAYLGGASLFAVDQPRFAIADAFDQALDASWQLENRRSGTGLPAIQLPRFLPAVLSRAGKRDEIPQVIAELKEEFAAPVVRFHELLRIGSVVPAGTRESAAAARELMQTVDDFFALVSSGERAPSWIRGFAPWLIKVGGGAWALYTKDSVLGFAVAVADTVIREVEKTSWGRRERRPSLADRLHSVHVPASALETATVAGLRKHLSPTEMKLITERG